jgi:hypothetical protein
MTVNPCRDCQSLPSSPAVLLGLSLSKTRGGSARRPSGPRWPPLRLGLSESGTCRVRPHAAAVVAAAAWGAGVFVPAEPGHARLGRQRGEVEKPPLPTQLHTRGWAGLGQ